MLARLVLVAAGMLLGFRLVFVWFSFGLVLVLLVLVCWFPVGSLVVRSSGPVLDAVDDVLDVICVVCLLCLFGLVGFASGSLGGETCLYIWGAYAVDRFSLHAAIDFTSSPSPRP
jgi:hypothetical protein